MDERRFLVSEATQHNLRVPGGGVTGTKKVVIEDGKLADGVVVSDEIWKVWREYEKCFHSAPFPLSMGVGEDGQSSEPGKAR